MRCSAMISRLLTLDPASIRLKQLINHQQMLNKFCHFSVICPTFRSSVPSKRNHHKIIQHFAHCLICILLILFGIGHAESGGVATQEITIRTHTKDPCERTTQRRKRASVTSRICSCSGDARLNSINQLVVIRTLVLNFVTITSIQSVLLKSYFVIIVVGVVAVVAVVAVDVVVFYPIVYIIIYLSNLTVL